MDRIQNQRCDVNARRAVRDNTFLYDVNTPSFIMTTVINGRPSNA